MSLADQMERLHREVERLRAERDEYARVALAGLSGLVPTPEKGYLADGGPGQLAADFRELRKLVARLRAAGLDAGPGGKDGTCP